MSKARQNISRRILSETDPDNKARLEERVNSLKNKSTPGQETTPTYVSKEYKGQRTFKEIKQSALPIKK